MTAGPPRGKRPRGRCPRCKRLKSLRADGAMRSHNYRETLTHCPGIGMPPLLGTNTEEKEHQPCGNS